MNKIKKLSFLLIGASASLSTGATNWYLGGDGTNLTTGLDGLSSVSWNGGGTIQNVAIYDPVETNITNTVIDNMTGGLMTGVQMAYNGTTFDLNIELLAADSSLPVTADFTVRSVNTGTGIAQRGAQGYGIEDLQNVAGIRVTSTFAEPISWQHGGANTGDRAWGWGMRNLVSEVTYDATLTLPDMITLTSDPISADPVLGVDYVQGTAPAGWFASPTDLAGSFAPMNTQTTVGTITTGSTPSIFFDNPIFQDWMGTEGADHDGDGNAYTPSATTVDEGLAQYTYLNTVDWLVTSPDGSAFDSGASFNFSMDGAQWGNIDDAIAVREALSLIPEPSSALLLNLAGLALLCKRRRLS